MSTCHHDYNTKVARKGIDYQNKSIFMCPVLTQAGLAIAEAVAGITKPTISLIIGGAHSIGIPIEVAAKRTFVAKSASMTIHPVRRREMIIGVHQSFEHLKKIQNRIIDFVVEHSHISKEKFQSLMLNNGELVSDIGTIVNGEEAVELGLCDEDGRIDFYYGLFFKYYFRFCK